MGYDNFWLVARQSKLLRSVIVSNFAPICWCRMQEWLGSNVLIQTVCAKNSPRIFYCQVGRIQVFVGYTCWWVKYGHTNYQLSSQIWQPNDSSATKRFVSPASLGGSDKKHPRNEEESTISFDATSGASINVTDMQMILL